MGLKVDSSFLKFVTMGALGARHVCNIMTNLGLRPVELERYSQSNKIWATKVKRLRLPDLLCVKTGLRVEVRAKSKLAIKMSDAENNPDRRWSSGLADRDMIAFVHIRDLGDGELTASAGAELFWVEDLKATVAQSRLGPAKSASEGAEKDRSWPATVPTKNGVVVSVSCEKIKATMEGGRSQTYPLNGKAPYVDVGDSFFADSQFIAGAPRVKAAFPDPTTNSWDPRPLLQSGLAVDRYCAVKALGFVGLPSDVQMLVEISQSDAEGRVALEAAASLVRLGQVRGIEKIRDVIANPSEAYLRMEALLILAEFHGVVLASDCVQLLLETANNSSLLRDEARQAAIWGLGKDGLKSYRDLIAFLNAESDEEAVHAICAFGPDVDAAVVDVIVSLVSDTANSPRLRSSASLILARIAPPELAVPRLEAVYQGAPIESRNWILATLGQMSPTAISLYLEDSGIKASLAPLQLTSPETNWTRSDRMVEMLSFVRKQTI